MPHKFKIGNRVNYRPKDRMLSTARGTYMITGLMPAIEDKPPEYRISTSAKNSSASQWKASCRPRENRLSSRAAS